MLLSKNAVRVFLLRLSGERSLFSRKKDPLLETVDFPEFLKDAGPILEGEENSLFEICSERILLIGDLPFNSSDDDRLLVYRKDLFLSSDD